MIHLILPVMLLHLIPLAPIEIVIDLVVLVMALISVVKGMQ